MLATLVALASILGAVIGFVTVWILVRSTIEASREKRAKQATDPLREQLAAMTNDRNYWRDRADAYETELRRREK